MSNIHDAEPIITHRFQWRNALADAVDEDFAATPRNRTKAGLRELRDNLSQWQSEDFAEMNELARTKSVNIDLRELGFNVRKQVQIPLQGQLWMMPALHQDLGAAKRNRLLDFLVDFVVSDYVSIVVPLHPV